MMYSGRELGELLCKAMDLDPTKVKSLTLNCTPQAFATVTVEYFLDVYAEGYDTFNELPSRIQTYELRPKEGT